MQPPTSTAPRRGLVYSDIRLKRELMPLDTLANGIKIYRFRYRWSGTVYVGVVAQEVAEVVPDAVIQDGDGYYLADYRRLGLQLRSYDDWVVKGHTARTAPAG